MKFLVMKECHINSSEQHCKPKYEILEAPSFEKAKEIVLAQGDNNYYPYAEGFNWKSIRDSNKAARVTLFELGLGRDTGYAEYYEECAAKQQTQEDAAARIKERQEYLRLHAIYGNS